MLCYLSDSYLKGWKLEQSSKSAIRDWILGLNLEGIDENNVNEIIDHPIGILVGSKFQPEAISRAIQLNIQGIRLARFKAERKSEYFVIVEDQIGKIVETSRKQWSWKDLVDRGLINASDNLGISNEGIRLVAKADPKYLDYIATKRVIFNDESVKVLLSRVEHIKACAPESECDWIDAALESIKKRESLSLTKATGLCFYAIGGPTASFWVPTPWWIHEKSGKSLEHLRNELFP